MNKIIWFASRHGRWGYAAFTLAMFVAGVHLVPDLVDVLVPAVEGYARAAIVKTIQASLAVMAVLLVLRTGVGSALAELGLRAPLGRALVVALMATLPMLVAFAATGVLRADYSLLILAVTGIFSPVAEEVLFRGYAFGQLHKRAGWGFWPAIMVPTVFFSAGHLYQADGPLEALGVFGVTAIGSVWFAWLYLRWNNLWVPIALHALMNLWWYLFEVDTSALGGSLANIARLTTMIVSIVLTLNRDRLWKSAAQVPVAPDPAQPDLLDTVPVLQSDGERARGDASE